MSRLPRQEFLSRDFKTIRTPYFSLKIKKNNTPKIRIGVVVGKAVYKSAVARNFLKRQAKEALSKNNNPGNDLLVIFSPAIKKLTKQNIQKELLMAVTRTL